LFKSEGVTGSADLGRYSRRGNMDQQTCTASLSLESVCRISTF